MSMVKNGPEVPAEGSLPSQEEPRDQGLEQEKEEELKEHSSVVVENGGGKENGDGVVEVLNSSVLETKVSVKLKGSDSDSEMNGVSSLLQMRGTGESRDASHEAEKLDSIDGSRKRVADGDDGLKEGASVGIGGGEERSDGKKSEEEVKDDDDGKIVTRDVPIVETSENVDDEVEELSDGGHVFAVGDFVWGKIKSHPWWPGRIYDPSDASDLALKLKQKNRQLLVAYFGDGTFAWCHPSQLKLFEENFDDMAKQSTTKAFVNAVQEAVNQVGMLLDMKMSRAFLVNESMPGFTLPLAKNAGIKTGTLVPENGVERLLAVPMEPLELLAQVKQAAEMIAVASILELETLKAQLSAFYLARGGYKLARFEDPQPVLGLEDKLTDETVYAGNGKSAVEVPVQGPFGEDYSASPMSLKVGASGNSQGPSGNTPNHRRKQKSMAEIMGEDKDVLSMNKEGDETDETLNAFVFTGRKRRRDREVAMSSKPVRERKELRVDTVANLQNAENKGSGGKQNSDKGWSPKSGELKEAFDGENISSGSRKENTTEGNTKEQNEKGSLLRERKLSKYLSPPFTTSLEHLASGRAAGQPSPRILKCNGETFKENPTKDVAVGFVLSDGPNHQTQIDEEEKTIDLKKIQVTPFEVLSEFRHAAVSPQISRDSDSLEALVDFISVFRSSLYRHGSLYKVYKECRPGRKRKKSETDQPDHLSPNNEFGPRKRRKRKGTENTSPAELIVSFWPGCTLPSKSDIVAIYSKFGDLNEAETNMFRTNYTARVCFLRASDAENALKQSQITNPFGSSDVTFQLKYLSSSSDWSKSERSASTKEYNTTLAVSLPKGNEASKFNYIREKLQVLTSMLEASDGESHEEAKNKVVSGMKDLLDDVDKIVGFSSS
ncbi:PWWP domain-containing protein 6-like [Arachis stenosperma]|uniref:PWWP domain-containing protein 6-like n=1 Tax=Arachis stenosperma TaxID=217475 RepID=UPI0025AC12E6|nr:PWWP domain-containing protein 6-like [Arachis stenosperma]